ncbi:CDP-alcohol phosphatidyltransferase family protein [Kineosporia babensis]|uniref:CDP-alcohol phosphatidyltransferase family protein n=1 Tax=Kineosporia babensis TaxID=499548 RepID=A0A9X1STW9_9ACTN|nr:CDP-alcohol phosphatidyltransferase family protein [Kineosporia babensis]
MGENPVSGTRVLNIPNLLSFGRLLLVPVFAALILLDHVGWAVVVLMVSGFTDYLDGTLARRWGQTTRLGQMLDPVADRLYILTTLLGLAYREVIPWWLVLLLIARDAVLVGSLLLMTNDERRPLEVSFLGKAATANLLYAFPLLLLGDIEGRFGDIAMPVGWAFAWWGTALYWWSALIYLRQAAAVLALREHLTKKPPISSAPPGAQGEAAG